jgi:carbon storage regulator
MLVLTRKVNESIVIDGCIRVKVVGVRNGQVRLGIEAPEHIRIFREELCNTAQEAEQEPIHDCALATPQGSLYESRGPRADRRR